MSREFELVDVCHTIEDGMITLRESGLTKVRAGLTTLDEVVRETVA